jgi:hypothetical protein
MIFGSVEPLESYCAHLLLSKDDLYFTVLETKGSRSIYGPRPTVQVDAFYFYISLNLFHRGIKFLLALIYGFCMLCFI